MFHVSRRTLLVGSGAAAMTSALPAFAQGAAMPPVRTVRANGINLEVYEVGSGPAVVLVHGFPGLSYNWRRQIPALAAAGYRVIVPNLRGYGGSDAPEAVGAYDIAHLTGDLVGLLDTLGIEKAVFMGHDWGGLVVWQMPLFHQARVSGVIGVNTPFIPHWMLWLHPDLVEAALPQGRTFVADPMVDPIAQMREVYSPDMYVMAFNDGRQADALMNADLPGTVRASYRKDLITAAEWPWMPREVAHMEYYGKPVPAKLPGNDILNVQDRAAVTRGFEHSGFTPPINWYRNISRNWKAGLDMDQTIRVPSLMISAEHDVVLRPSMADGMERHVPDLERHVVADCWHWTPEEKPEELNRLAISWLRRRVPPAP